MRSLIFILSAIYLFSFYSCEYEFSESNYVAINDTLINSLPVIDVTELITGDTIDIFNEVNISYNISLSDIILYKVEITLNDQLIYENNSLSGTVLINPHYLPNGEATLSIHVFSNKGTGSLADIYQKDTLYYTNSWIVNLDAAAPLKNNISNIYCENGTLKIKWEKYPKTNFKAYYLIRNYKNHDDASDVWPEEDDEVIAVFYDRDSLECTDSTFVGGRARYYISVENLTKSGPYPYSENLKTKGDSYIFMDDYPILSYQPLDGGRLILKWTKSPYFKNFDHYVIQSHLYGSVPQTNREFGIADTFAVENYGVPYESRYGLSLKSGDTYRFCALLQINQIGVQLPYLFRWISFDSGNGYYYLRKNLQELQVINMQDYSLIKSRSDIMAFGSPTYEASMNSSYIAGTYNSGIINYSNCEITQTGTGISIGWASLNSGSVTNQGFMNYYTNPIFTGYQYTYHGIIDLKGDSQVFLNQTNGVIISDLSVNSHYYALSTSDNLKIFTFDNTDIHEILSINSLNQYSWLEFSKNEENLLYVFHADDNENKIEVRDGNQSFDIVQNYPVQATRGFSYDPITETISGLDENYQIFVYHAKTGEEIIRLQSYFADNYPLLFNGTLFFQSVNDWDNGYIYEIPGLHEN